ARHVKAIADRTGSLALKSNSQHLLIDCVTSVGVLVALFTTKLTGLVRADAVFALLLAGWMAVGAWRLAKQAFDQLIDRSLTDAELDQVRGIIRSQAGVMGYHRLRSRLSGDTRYVEMHVVVPTNWSLVQAHDTADDLEKHIATALTPAVVVIHVDPYDPAKDAGNYANNME
ncbi:MAG: cation diffusion facilitator family transporter, partial [Chlorobia bacterium]|nr:cation diffusion facilitator family transporter [Fimbriimonadaceae bacterium]